MNVWNGIGNLTRDPQVSYTTNGTAVCEVGLAINEKRKVGDQWEDAPVFIDLTLWGRTAEVCGEYCSKGSKIAVEGKLKLDQWNDKETGQKRSKLKVEGQRIHLLSQRNGDSRGAPQNQQPEPQGHWEDSEVPF